MRGSYAGGTVVRIPGRPWGYSVAACLGETPEVKAGSEAASRVS